MGGDKNSFYEAAAKRFAASTVMYGVDSVVHVEDKDDIWFWQQLLSKYRTGRYKFLPATINEKGYRNTGCTQCLKYKDFLSQKFFVCIDSDLRYLLGENIFASRGVLQTYTYSWENHTAFAPRLQQSFDKYIHKEKNFDFVSFLQEYSEILYKPFLLMLYQEKNGLSEFNREKFKSFISLQYKQGDEQENGQPFLVRLASELTIKGVQKGNVYLYVRGHCLYNSLVSLGKKLCEGFGVDFEQNILKDALAFEQYDAILRIRTDIGMLKTCRRCY